MIPQNRPRTPSEIKARFSPRAVARRLLYGTDTPRGWPTDPPIRTGFSEALDGAVDRAAGRIEEIGAEVASGGGVPRRAPRAFYPSEETFPGDDLFPTSSEETR